MKKLILIIVSLLCVLAINVFDVQASSSVATFSNPTQDDLDAKKVLEDNYQKLIVLSDSLKSNAHIAHVLIVNNKLYTAFYDPASTNRKYINRININFTEYTAEPFTGSYVILPDGGRLIVQKWNTYDSVGNYRIQNYSTRIDNSSNDINVVHDAYFNLRNNGIYSFRLENKVIEITSKKLVSLEFNTSWITSFFNDNPFNWLNWLGANKISTELVHVVYFNTDIAIKDLFQVDFELVEQYYDGWWDYIWRTNPKERQLNLSTYANRTAVTTGCTVLGCIEYGWDSILPTSVTDDSYEIKNAYQWKIVLNAQDPYIGNKEITEATILRLKFVDYTGEYLDLPAVDYYSDARFIVTPGVTFEDIYNTGQVKLADLLGLDPEYFGGLAGRSFQILWYSVNALIIGIAVILFMRIAGIPFIRWLLGKKPSYRKRYRT